MTAPDLARLFALAALWGGSFAFIRVAVPALGPLWLAESRVALASVALFALAFFRREVPALRKHWRGFLMIGVVNSALPFALFSFAEVYINASTAAILNATSPFFGAVAGAIWLKDSLTPAKLAGMALGLAGVVTLVGWHPAPLAPMTVLAIGACLVAALCYGIAGVYAKLRMTGVPSPAIALYSQMSAAIVLLPTLSLSVAPPVSTITLLIATNVLALALASTAIAYLLYFRLIANVGPARALTVTFLIPVFGVLWGFVFLDEPLTANMLSGGALILAGTWFAVRAKAVDSGTREARQGSR